MISIALAGLLGLAAFPLVLVYGPAYFPWTLLVLASFGGVVGLSITSRGPRSRLFQALALSAMVVAVIIGVLRFTTNIGLSLDQITATLVWASWLALPILTGMLAGTWLRARMGILRGASAGAAMVALFAVVGTGLAFALAPPEVANASTCGDNFECPRAQCGSMAERRRILAIERVTAFDADGITCTYTAWGGITIGKVDVRRGAGASWTDGAWPELLLGRGR